MHIQAVSRGSKVLPAHAQITDEQQMYRASWAALLIALLGAVFVPQKL